MFDYSIHKIFCPLCKRIREEFAKSSGTNYYIKGHGENIYYKDTCSLCKKSYYLIAGNNGILEMRINGLSLEEAIEKKKQIIKDEKDESFQKFHNFITCGRDEYCHLNQKEIERIEEKCNEIYGIDENELVIPAELVNKDDLIVESVWMS